MSRLSRFSAIAKWRRNGPARPEAGAKRFSFNRSAIAENRLNLDIRSAADGGGETILLPLAPFRGIVKDYFMVCESYYAATRRAGLAQIEALDVGRRSLHDEGSALLRDRLADRVAIDHATARRLFTLICVLHLRGVGAG